MTEKQKAALRIVLDLAIANALVPDDYEHDPALFEQAVEQQRAIARLERMLR